MKYHCLTSRLYKTAHTIFESLESFDLAGLRKKVGDNLVEKPGMPEMIFLPSEIQAAKHRANLMESCSADLVVTLICGIEYHNSTDGELIRVESVLYSQLEDRITEMKVRINGIVTVLAIYSEETSQLFELNGVGDVYARLPNYEKHEMERKRVAYRK